MTMTKRQTLEAIKNFVNVVMDSEIGEELKAEYNELPEAIVSFCDKELDHMNKALEKRSSKPSKKSEENAPIKAAILAIIKELGGKTASDLTLALQADFEGIKVQKVSSLCRQLVEAQELVCAEVKVPKKGKQILYSLVEADEA